MTTPENTRAIPGGAASAIGVNTPKVTVLMPTYNAARYLAEALSSILAQTFTDFELLLIDDGSTDETPTLVSTFRDPRIRYVRHVENAGLAPRLNEGLALARGQYIARLDADDVSREDWLVRQVKALDEDPDLAVIAANWIIIDERGGVLTGGARAYNDHENLWYLCISNPFRHSAISYRRRVVLDELGGYDQTITYGEDYELWSRLTRKGYRARQLPDTLAAIRLQPSSMSNRLAEHKYATNVAIIQKNLQFVFPDASSFECLRFAEHVAAVNFRRVPISHEFVREYLGFYRRFCAARGLSMFQMRRALSSHFIRWGWFAKPYMRWRALAYVAEGVLLEPRHVTQFVLPSPIRRVMAHMAGQFWMERA